jgi:uncharacterized protein (TIGR02145 family)
VKILKYILIAIVLLVSEQNILSQYYLKVKSNTTSLESDSALIFVNGYRGTINWQASSDLINWVSLNKHNDTLGVRIDSSAYYRATIIEENCNPVMSDTAFLIEKLTITNSNQFTVESTGGVFLLPSGIKVKIPKGVVIKPKVVILNTICADSINKLAVMSNTEYQSFLSGISIATDTFNFRKPIKIKIPIKNLDMKNLPVLYELNNEHDAWLFSNKSMIVNIPNKFVEIIVKGSNQKTTTKGKKSDPADFNIFEYFFIKYSGEFFEPWFEDPCRWGRYNAVTKDYDYVNSGGCSVVQTKNELIYYDCDGSPSSSYEATKINPSCVPDLDVYPRGCKKVKKGEQGSKKLTTEIGGLPLPNQKIDISKSDNLSAPEQITTGSDGSVSLDVKGLEIGYGSILLSVSFDYYSTSTRASGIGLRESNTYDRILKQREYSTCFTVYDVPKVETGSVSNIQCTTANVSGVVIDSCYDKISERGVEVNGKKYQSGMGSFSGMGPFSVGLSGLECYKEYNVRAYAINKAGIGYGNSVMFTTKKLVDCISLATTVPDTNCLYTVSTKIVSDCIIRERGFYYSNDNESTWNKVSMGSGTGTYATRFGAKPQIDYYVKAFATTECGTVYGDEVILPPIINTITDINGNVYNTVKIGNQVWMKENLRTTTLIDGTDIPEVTNNDWSYQNAGYCDTLTLHIGNPARCWYDNNSNYKYTYGALYNGYAVNSGSLCPTGWHVPSETDWQTLFQNVINLGYTFAGAGGRLKEIGTTHWLSPNTNATDEFCFTALPGGNRESSLGCLYYDATFQGLGYEGSWWTSTRTFFGNNGVYRLSYISIPYNIDATSVGRGVDFRRGFSVRCLKNSTGNKGQIKRDISISKEDSLTILPMGEY